MASGTRRIAEHRARIKWKAYCTASEAAIPTIAMVPARTSAGSAAGQASIQQDRASRPSRAPESAPPSAEICVSPAENGVGSDPVGPVPPTAPRPAGAGARPDGAIAPAHRRLGRRLRREYRHDSRPPLPARRLGVPAPARLSQSDDQGIRGPTGSVRHSSGLRLPLQLARRHRRSARAS